MGACSVTSWGDLCCTKCMLLFHVTPVVSSLEHLFVSVKGPRAVGCPQCRRECLLSGWGALTCGFLVEMTAAGFCTFVSSHLLFHDEFSQGRICYIWGGFRSFTVLLTAARRVLGNPDAPWKDILSLFYTVITR